MKYHIEFDLDFKKNTYPGKFIVIEGIDAAGKTTHVKLLKEYLAKNKNVFVTKNPTVGEIGQFIRRALREEFPTTSIAIQYLYAADRQVQQLEIIEHLEKGEIVLADRYFWSSLAYGPADKEDVDFEKHEQMLLISLSMLSTYYQFILPDMTFYIDISPAVAMERLGKMDKTHEVYEKKDVLERVTKGYKWTIEKFKEYFVVVSGERPISEVDADIKNHLQSLI